MNAEQAVRSRRGNYSILMGGTIFAIMGFAALAVDISLITMAELQCQAAADAASHAALVAYRNSGDADPTVDGDAAAQFMVDRNEVAMGIATLDAVRYGSYDRVADTFCVNCSSTGNINAVQVDVSRIGGNAVDLLLAPMFGVFTHDVNADSITAQQERAIMLVQDFSCSMDDKGGGPTRPIDVSRYANWLFLDYMVRNAQDGDMLGVTGYAEWAPSESATGARATSIAGAEFWDSDPGPAPWARLTELNTTENIDYVKGRISAICSPRHGCPDDTLTESSPAIKQPVRDLGDDGGIGACTNPSIGINMAMKQLRERTDDTYFRGMVVMSDGKFNCRGGDAAALAAAATAYDVHDISIWTIGYSGGSLDSDMMRSLTKGFGFYQESPSFDDLPAMYATVAEALPTAIVD